MFDDMTADMESNKKLSPKVTELFLRGRKLNISLDLYYNLISRCLKLQDYTQHIILSWKFLTKDNFNK